MPKATNRDRPGGPAASTASAGARHDEARYRFLLENTSEIVTVVDADGLITWQSPSVERVLRIDGPTLAGTSIYTWVHPDDDLRVQNAIVECLTDPTSRPTFEFRWQHADRSWRRIEAIAANHLAEPSIGGIVLTARDVTERSEFEDQLARQVFYDPLTGLPNRVLFTYFVEHALAAAGRSQGGVAVMFLDIDNFKTINDSLGHTAGDQLLMALGQRLKGCLRPADVVARLGGDEFTILLEQLGQSEVAERVAARIINRLQEPFMLDGREMYVTASVGIAFGTPNDVRADDLVRFADSAMYRAKTQGKARAILFDRSMHAAWVARLSLESDLRQAVENVEVRLHYQPIVHLATNAIVGVEALVRWQHAERGLLAPAEFLTLAEETGLIVPIGQWVLEEACQQARAWQTGARHNPSLWISANLSGREFQQPGLVDQVTRALERSGLDPTSLRLEVTESVALDESQATAEKLEALQALGVRLVLDDFGTGYSSLNYLRRLPARMLKLDPTLVAGLEAADTASVVQAVIALAHALGMDVTAEGVETAEQLDRLRALGCDLGQGYYFSHPVDADEIGALLNGVVSSQ